VRLVIPEGSASELVSEGSKERGGGVGFPWAFRAAVGDPARATGEDVEFVG